MKKKWDTYKVYIIISVLCILIRVIPISSGSEIFDDAMNDIAIGGLASTLVALFIFMNDMKKRKMLLERVSNTTQKDVYRFIHNYLKWYCDVAVHFMGVNKNEEKSFEEWSIFTCEKLEEDAELNKKVSEYFFVQIDNLLVALERIISNLEWYELSEMFDEEELDFIKEVYELFHSYDCIWLRTSINTRMVKVLNDSLIELLNTNKKTVPWISEQIRKST